MKKNSSHCSKNVTFFISSISGGGAEGVCINIANTLSHRGWDVTIVVLNLINIDYKDRIDKKVKLISLDVSHARYSFFKIRRLIQNKNIKKVVAFDYVMVVILSIINKSFLKKKFYLILRNINTLSKKKIQKQSIKQMFIYKLLNWTLFQVDFIVNQCKEMQDDLLKIYTIEEKKINYIYNPVATNIEKIANSGYTEDKENYFLCIGRLETQKAFEYAIQSFSIFVKKVPGFKLKIVGKGSLENYLKRMAEKYGVADDVEFMGFQSNTIPFYQKARATLLTSHYEGFPNVLIESITLGTPVISFNCKSGPDEIIEEHKNGYLVEYQNVEQFALCMEKIVSETINPKQVKTYAHKYFEETVISQWEALLLKENF